MNKPFDDESNNMTQNGHNAFSNEIRRILSNSYAFSNEKMLWLREGAESFSYSDGDEVETRIAGIIDAAFDRSSESLELEKSISDWPTTYHLSSNRANLLKPVRGLLKGRVLEIGAGTGAITRFLGEQAEYVVAVEGSIRRASIASRRCLDLPNVTVVADDFAQFPDGQKFDVVTLIGVLEYARVFFTASNGDPVNALLERAKSFLRPGGILIVAIENQLGLKYFAGSAEDHLGKAMFGIEDRYTNDTPVCFGKVELSQKLEASGLHQQQWWFPLPDYKVPVSVFSDRVTRHKVNLSDLLSESVRTDPQLVTPLTFSLERAWQPVFRNGLGTELANSFLVLCSDEALPEHNVLAVHYGGSRRREFKKEVRFEWTDNGVHVRRVRMYPKSISSDPKIISMNLVDEPFVEGRNWHKELVDLLSREGWTLEEWNAWAQIWFNALLASLSLATKPFPSSTQPVGGDAFDKIPRNLIFDENNLPIFIDQEWIISEPTELGFLVFRGIFDSLQTIKNCAPPATGYSTHYVMLFQSFVKTLGWDITPDDLLRFEKLEGRIQTAVSDRGERAPSTLDSSIPIRAGFDSLRIGGLEGRLAELYDQLHLKAEELENAIASNETALMEISNLSMQLEEGRRQFVDLSLQLEAQQVQIASYQSESAHRAARKMQRRFRALLVRLAAIWRHPRNRAKRKVYRNHRIALLGTSSSKDSLSQNTYYPPALSPDHAARDENHRPAQKTMEPVALDIKDGKYVSKKGSANYVYVTPQKPLDFEDNLENLKEKPFFSIVVPAYNTPLNLMESLVSSVRSQWYTHWELIIVDDASPEPHYKKFVESLNDSRIKVEWASVNRGIADTTNRAIELSGGDYIILLDHDDELTVDCLYELALCIDKTGADYVYSDEDKIDPNGHHTMPHFKPDWSPDTMMSTMYVCHVSCIKRDLINDIGGFRSEFNGCQDWDLVLRLTEKTDKIAHIPKVLYHWRIIPGSISAALTEKPYAIDASKRVREDALRRRGLEGIVEPVAELPGHFTVRYKLNYMPKVSIIIPTRDNAEVLERCVSSLLQRSTYTSIEIIIINNGSTHPQTISHLNRLKEEDNVKIIDSDTPFNFSYLCNLGATHSNGDFLLFLNDDTEVLTEDFLERMLGFAALRHVGAVGAKLLYPHTNQVQHSGVLNLDNGPGHAFLQWPSEAPGYFARNVLEYNWLAVTGACMMVQKKKFMEVGGFSEDLPVAYNDVDICCKFIDAGYFNVVCPQAKLYHHESVSRGSDNASKEKKERLKEDLLKFYEKNPKYYRHDPFHNINLHPNSVYFEYA
ncbi:glycosyltransferase [Agrobacterium tumefaciens]|uniref:Glycosyltransferase n=1 Tax=Agrobacterium tumefaciens TaxID=358 RepID=A0A4D7YL43_AGRTU|nr:glycosyltransferase [Agrobacterium tumefaciens]QCL97215.1 glycosyltransferase [Agrobacterium tumefaciens]